MPQADKLKRVLKCGTDIPKGYIDFMASRFLKQHDKYHVKFYPHWTEPKLGAAK
jgi:hypothetical protein